MNTLGERLNYARKQKGYTQDSLAQTIGVSRGVIFNLEKNKTEPQAIVINAVCQILNINKEWLTDGTGDMESGNQAFQSANCWRNSMILPRNSQRMNSYSFWTRSKR